ncbi:zinc ribbon domain-containing protein [Methanohalophilus sp. DAL1]|jgi:hypothetical protein|uniref:zinc ribbon domain-containing protein n=1 Tax=Methanohalophilus sp. DAL1 TaxID=1864608 RepID=UPI0008174F2A|nr:zinc ribbon domain-containing protein [Methanohalophilus sp. DAL1]OBZ36075.1 MAG: hypothetical protein A9957_04205 [Methanohalophilus sp. DAL1]
MDEQNEQKRHKEPDEMFCRSCGIIIKKEAEICPHCGVRNLPGTSPSIKKSHSSASLDWYKALIGSSLLWLFLWIFVALIADSPRFDALIGFLLLIAWIVLPIALYNDSEYVKKNTDTWNPNSVLWAIGGCIWLLNLIVVLVYIIKRNESMN